MAQCDRCRQDYTPVDQKQLGPLVMNCGKGLCPRCYKWLLNWFTPEEKRKD